MVAKTSVMVWRVPLSKRDVASFALNPGSDVHRVGC
jgi:hypothetical protein